jgi:hypothetical protein
MAIANINKPTRTGSVSFGRGLFGSPSTRTTPTTSTASTAPTAFVGPVPTTPITAAPPVVAPPVVTPTSVPSVYFGSQPSSYYSTTTSTPPVTSPVVQQSQPAAAVTYEQAIQFRDGPIGSQIPRIERLLRPSNWNNTNKNLRAQYLKEIGEAINNPVKYSSDQLEKDSASYLFFQNKPNAAGISKAEAADLKSNIDKYVTFLQNNGQSQAAIESIVTKGSIEGSKVLSDYITRINDVSLLDRVVDVGLQAGLAISTAGLSLPAQIGINVLLQLGNDANPADIVRNVVATIAANSLTYGIPGIESSKIIPKTLNEINKTIANLAPGVVSPTAVSALINAERQSVAALITKQDVGQNALAGALGGTIADLSKAGFDDPLIQKTIGEYAKYNALGMSPLDSALMAGIDYVGDVSSSATQKTETTTGKSTDEIAVAPAPFGSKVGSDLAAVGDIDFTVPSNIANKQEFKTSPGEVGENIIKYTDRDGEVSYRKNVTSTTPDGKKFGYTIVYNDIDGISYEYQEKAKDLTSGGSITATKTRPSVENLNTPTKTGVDTTDTSPINLSVKPVVTQTGQGASTGTQTKLDINKGTSTAPVTGAAGGSVTTDAGTVAGGGVTTTPSESTEVTKATDGTSATGGDLTKPVVGDLGTETSLDKDIINLTGIGTGGAGGDALTTGGTGTGGTGTGTETGGAGEGDGGGGITEDTTVTKPPTESIILDLISGNNQIKPKTRIPTTAERESLQALSQALRIGDPGDALFGGKLGRRRNVWNEESLRLKDELGG